MSRIVADTGPLLHLGEADLWPLLAASGRVVTTPCVVAEWRHNNVAGATLPDWLIEETPSPESKISAQGWVSAGLLHKGEAESLAHAREIRAEDYLTDDTAAREMARGLGINARGSLGVVLMLAARKQLTHQQASAAMERLWRHSTLWLSPRVRSEAAILLDRIFTRPGQ